MKIKFLSDTTVAPPPSVRGTVTVSTQWRPQLLASDWWMGGWKQRTCSTGMFSPSPDFRYLFRMAKISLFRTWNLLILSTIFFRD